MRLFIAIEFDDVTKNRIYNIIEKIKHLGYSGSFVRYDNLHLTLKFIGEQNSYKNILTAMAAAERFNRFKISLSGFGFFKDILWMGVNEGGELTKLYETLENSLSDLGFGKETRPFRPHITLARRFKNRDFSYENSEVVDVNVNSITLMESILGDRVVYKPIKRVYLK